MSWNTGRPIFHRLPGENGAYTDNFVVDALTSPWDELLLDTKDKLDNYYSDYLDPDTALDANLPWLAQLCGFTGEYSLVSYPVTAQREFIKKSFSFIWPFKGSRPVLEFVLSLVSGAKLYILGEFLADISKCDIDTLGADTNLIYFVLMPLSYLRTSPNWTLAKKLLHLYAPAYTKGILCYEHFYADFSACGEPLFD